MYYSKKNRTSVLSTRIKNTCNQIEMERRRGQLGGREFFLAPYGRETAETTTGDSGDRFLFFCIEWKEYYI